MKTRRFSSLPLGSVGAVLLSLSILRAEVPVEPATPSFAVSLASPGAVERLPYGVEDVLTLSRAQIGETLIVNYIKNSGTIYSLQPKVIVYLRDQGVSERVINTMLEQKKAVPEEVAKENAAQAAATLAVPGPPYPQPVVFNLSPSREPAPSTLHVIPYPAATRAYYGHYQPYQVRGGYWGGNSPVYRSGYAPVHHAGYAPVHHGGYFGYRYGCASTVVTIHSGFGGHTPHFRGR